MSQSDPQTTEDSTRSGFSIFWRVALQVGFLVGIAVLAYFFFDFDKIKVAFQNLSLGVIGIYVGLMLLIRLINSWRWLMICQECLGLENYSYWFIVRVSLLVEFVNVWFPSFIGGEAVKVWKLSQEDEMSKMIPISVLLDRVVGIASLGVVCLPFLVLFPPFLPDLQAAAQNPLILWGGVAFGLAVIGAGLWKRKMFLNLARRSWGFFVDNNYLVGPMLVSILGYPVMVLAYYLLFWALEPQGWLDTSVVTLVPRFGRIFPVSAFGVGAVEGGTVIVGKYLSMSAQVLVVVVAVHVSSKYVASLLGALLEVIYEGTSSFRKLLEDAPEADQERSAES